MKPAPAVRVPLCLRTLLGAVAILLTILGAPLAHAQVAITEVMAYPALSFTNTSGFDWWELTNFGTNSVNISRWEMADNRDSWVPLPPGLVIEPGGSLVFFETNSFGYPTTDEFRAWWGLQPSVRVFPLGMPGLSQFGDWVRLRDADGVLVDRVEFGPSRRGISKTYDSITGVFGVDIIDTTNACPAIFAVAAPEIGSPGITCGTVPLQIVVPPTNQFAPLGCCAEFAVNAGGLPPPRYQWSHDGVLIPGATTNALKFCDLQLTNAGVYCVSIANGLQELPTPCATLTLGTNPSPPVISTPPRNCTALEGHSAIFRVAQCAYPPAALQWYVNGTPILNETSPTLIVPECQLGMSASVYCLQASNELGTNSACAVLTVISYGALRITEAMARSRTNQINPKIDWVEITNFGADRLHLSGFRLMASRLGGLEGAFTIPEGVIIRPNESIICAEARTRDEFTAWWGADNLPQDIQVLTWKGWGISADDRESITLWNQTTEDSTDVIDKVTPDVYPESVSLYFDDACPQGCPSDPADRGTFFAVNGRQLGSPSYEVAPNLNMWINGAEVILRGRSRVGRTYSLQFKDRLQDADWSALPPSQIAIGAAVIFRDSPSGASRFYRLVEEFR